MHSLECDSLCKLTPAQRYQYQSVCYGEDYIPQFCNVTTDKERNLWLHSPVSFPQYQYSMNDQVKTYCLPNYNHHQFDGTQQLEMSIHR